MSDLDKEDNWKTMVARHVFLGVWLAGKENQRRAGFFCSVSKKCNLGCVRRKTTSVNKLKKKVQF